MKKINLIKGLLPATVALTTIPLATIVTSCNKKSPEQSKDFVSFDKVQKSMYGIYDEPLAKGCTVKFDGFVLKDGFSIDDLEVSIKNSDFEGYSFATIVANEDNTFKVYVLFRDTTILYGQKTTFDLVFSHKASEGHIQTLTDLSVEFMLTKIVIEAVNFRSLQYLVTTQNQVSFITDGVFTAYSSEGEEITDLSDFYIETFCYSETVKASAEIVPLYDNEFVIRLNLDNITVGNITMAYSIKSKKLPDWKQDFIFNLNISTNVADGFEYEFSSAEPYTATITSCYLQDKSVEIPNKITKGSKEYTVTGIGDNAFTYCLNIKELTIPASITKISSDESNPFSGTNIETIKVASGNTKYTSTAKINGTTQECNCIMEKPTDESEPTNILFGFGKTKIADSINAINKCAFQGIWGLEEISLPDNVLKVGEKAFQDCMYLKKANLNKAKTLGSGLLDNCSSLEELSLGDAVQSIPTYFVRDCESLKTITIPKSVTSIADNAFIHAKNIEDFIVDDANETYSSKDINGNECHCIMSNFALCHGCKNTIIPNGILSIEKDCFDGMGGFKTISIPSTVLSIGKYAFYKCPDLESIDISNAVQLDSYVLADCGKLKNVTLCSSLEAIPGHAFTSCNSLESITLPTECTKVGSSAFRYCRKLTTVNGTENLKEINAYAFECCLSLKEFNFPSSLVTIGNYAFGRCYSIEKVDLTQCTSLIALADHVFDSCTSMTEIDLSQCTALLVIGNSCFENCLQLPKIDLTNCTNLTQINDYTFDTCASLTKVLLPTTCTSIGNYAFRLCTSLEQIDLSNVTTIKNVAFEECSSLTTVTLTDKTTTIGNSAFIYCSSLKTIQLKDVTSIGKRSFLGCKSLTSVNLSKIDQIPEEAFKSCSSLSSITFSDNLTTIGDEAFVYCESLASVTFPINTLQTIGTGAFGGCALTTVTIPTSVTAINSYAFFGCEALTSVTFTDTTKTWTMGETTISKTDIANAQKMAEILKTATEDLTKNDE